VRPAESTNADQVDDVSRPREPEFIARQLPAITIAVGAFLLFSIEPMVGKVALPWFGGSAEVWTACLAFFQVALFVGYLYARVISRRATASQRRIHAVLLLVSLAFLPVLPTARWKPTGTEYPLAAILVMLTATIGLPFVVLASTSPLVQSWLAPARSSRASAYRLFALSNFASLLALLSYPTAIEPSLTIRSQGILWSFMYAGFVLLALGTIWSQRGDPVPRLFGPRKERLNPVDPLLWFALSAVPSALLLAITEYMLRNIAPIPLLWIAPLALYLVSLILSFGWTRWYIRPVWYLLFVTSAYAMTSPISSAYLFGSYRSLLFLYSAGFFVCCCVCHAELVAIQPAPARLTQFYLMIAAGGAAGGLLIAAVAPSLLNTGAYDLPVIIGLALCLVVIAAWRRLRSVSLRWRVVGQAVCLILVAIFTWRYVVVARNTYGGPVLMSKRSFFGWVRVVEAPDDPALEQTRELLNGYITHGKEFTAEDRRQEPLTYYTPDSGIGITIRQLGRAGTLRVGVIGLGAGTLAGYGRAGDVFRFYELDPTIDAIARQYFWYLHDCAASWTVITGDARLSLERESSQQFDVLVVDAFTSDAVPTHLLTQEAFTLYWRHLKPDGVLAIHVTNRYLNLAEVVAAAASAFHKTAKLLVNADDSDAQTFSSDWVLMTSRPGFFTEPALQESTSLPPDPSKGWTDDYSSLWRQLR
jgi:SAM-dependent methyltransferase